MTNGKVNIVFGKAILPSAVDEASGFQWALMVQVGIKLLANLSGFFSNPEFTRTDF